MELVVVALSQGIIIGLVAFDFASRILDRKERRKAAEDLKAAQAGLAELHNKSAEQVRALADKVGAHEFALKQRMPK